MIRQPFPPPLADNPRARRFRPAGFPCGFTGRAAGVSKYKGCAVSAQNAGIGKERKHVLTEKAGAAGRKNLSRRFSGPQPAELPSEPNDMRGGFASLA